MQMQHKFGLCAHSVPLISLFCFFVFFLFKSASVTNKSADILRRSSHLHSVHSVFCRLFKEDVLENCLFVLKTRSKFVHANEKCFDFFPFVLWFFSSQFGRGVTGIRCSSPSAVCRALCDASFVFATQRLEMIDANIYIYIHTHTAYTYESIHIYIYFCCFFAIN